MTPFGFVFFVCFVLFFLQCFPIKLLQTQVRKRTSCHVQVKRFLTKKSDFHLNRNLCVTFPSLKICFVDINKVVIAPSRLKHLSPPVPAQPGLQPTSPVYDPYAGMKTPGQRQLISLQERVKVGEITVDEAVEEFKAWQFDHKQRAFSMRYRHVWISTDISRYGLFTDIIVFWFFFLAQENLRRLRESITRRHKEKQKPGKDPGW